MSRCHVEAEVLRQSSRQFHSLTASMLLMHTGRATATAVPRKSENKTLQL